MSNSLRTAVEKRLVTVMQEGIELDVAIVGAGVSGLYTAWRLTSPRSDGRTPKVQILELSNRIGGRLESVQLPGMQIAGELGGMRYMTQQAIVTSLIEQVFANQLQSIPFPMGDPNPHFFYGRTQRCRADAWTIAQTRNKKFSTNYFLPAELVGFSSDQLFNKIFYEVATADPWFMANFKSSLSATPPWTFNINLTSKQWDEVKPNLTYCLPGPYQGMKVNDMGFWNLIKDVAGEEVYNFLSDAGGYYSNTLNWNAAEAFPYMLGDFSKAGTVYKTIGGGYDQIAYAMADAYFQGKDSAIWTGNRLETFERMPEGAGRRYRLTIYNVAEKKHWHVYTNAIVLALPRRSLELLDQSNFFFNPETAARLQQSITSTIMEPSFKLLMAFEHPWWKGDFGAMAGESITDLPMRQCYYFGTDPKDSHSMFLAGYNDMRSVSFWEPLEPPTHLPLVPKSGAHRTYAHRPKQHPLFEPRATKLVTQRELEPLRVLQATKVMVDEAMKQIRELHGPQVGPIPEPYVTWFKDWTQDPFGGGYHGWKAGVPVREVMQYMRAPMSGEAIHICGEAYSDQQGWVEGAFCVAERMLQKHFHMTWPTWLDRSYYLGW